MFEPETTLYETDTAVEHYAVVERQYEGRPARVLFSGQRRAAQSGIGLDDNPDLLFDYNQRLLELASGLYPRRILMIGGGAFTLPMALKTALPDATIDVVELDAGLEPIARQYFGLQTDARLQLHWGDGRQFIETTAVVYDMIIIDAFQELMIPARFRTLEFVQAATKKLAPGGCLAMNIIATYQGRNAGLLLSQIAAYRQVLDAVAVYPAAHGLTSWLPQNLILCGQRPPTQDVTHFVRYAAIELPPTSDAELLHDADQ